PRLFDYQREWLDALCLGGQVAWARLSPRTRSGNGDRREVSAPTRAAPLALLLRRDLEWLRAPAPALPVEDADLGGAARAVHQALAAGGAMFLVDLVERLSTERGRPVEAAEIEGALWELVG